MQGGSKKKVVMKVYMLYVTRYVLKGIQGHSGSGPASLCRAVARTHQALWIIECIKNPSLRRSWAPS